MRNSRLLVRLSLLVWLSVARASPWVEEAKLQPPGGYPANAAHLALAINGERALIGAATDQDIYSNGPGSVHVFSWNAGVWTQTAQLFSDDESAPDGFGRAVASAGNVALVGAPSDYVNGVSSGAVYVFERAGDAWIQTAKLLSSDGTPYDAFGSSVAYDDNTNTAVVGAWGDDDNGSRSGSVYVFTRTDEVWTQQAKLLASDGFQLQRFGLRLSVDGDTFVTGTWHDNGGPGSAYVFTRSGSVWSEQIKLVPADAAPEDFFGQAVALVGDTVLVGAPGDDDNGNNSGSVYRFTRTAGVWVERTKLLPANGDSHAGFGRSLALDGATAVVGTSHSAYVFTQRGETWVEEAELQPAGVSINDEFGASVALHANVTLVQSRNGADPNSVYVFRSLAVPTPAVDGLGAVLLLMIVLGAAAYLLQRPRDAG